MTETVYEFIRAYWEANHMAPTLREISSGCLINVATVMRHLDRLEAEGRIFREPHKARSIRLIHQPDNSP